MIFDISIAKTKVHVTSRRLSVLNKRKTLESSFRWKQWSWNQPWSDSSDAFPPFSLAELKPLECLTLPRPRPLVHGQPCFLPNFQLLGLRPPPPPSPHTHPSSSPLPSSYSSNTWANGLKSTCHRFCSRPSNVVSTIDYGCEDKKKCWRVWRWYCCCH